MSDIVFERVTRPYRKEIDSLTAQLEAVTKERDELRDLARFASDDIFALNNTRPDAYKGQPLIQRLQAIDQALTTATVIKQELAKMEGKK